MQNQLLKTVLNELKEKKNKSCDCDVQEQAQVGASEIKRQKNRFVHPNAKMRNECGKYKEGSELYDQCIYDVMNKKVNESVRFAIHQCVTDKIMGKEEITEDLEELIRGVKKLHGLIATHIKNQEEEDENDEVNEQAGPYGVGTMETSRTTPRRTTSRRSGSNIGISQRGPTKGQRIYDVAAPLPGTPEYESNPEVYQAMQNALNIAGAAPFVGIPADLVATGHSLYHGKPGDALLNLAGVLPVAGEAKAGAVAAIPLLSKLKKGKSTVPSRVPPRPPRPTKPRFTAGTDMTGDAAKARMAQYGQDAAERARYRQFIQDVRTGDARLPYTQTTLKDLITGGKGPIQFGGRSQSDVALRERIRAAMTSPLQTARDALESGAARRARAADRRAAARQAKIDRTLMPKIDPKTGRQMIDPKTKEPLMTGVPGAGRGEAARTLENVQKYLRRMEREGAITSLSRSGKGLASRVSSAAPGAALKAAKGGGKYVLSSLNPFSRRGAIVYGTAASGYMADRLARHFEGGGTVEDLENVVPDIPYVDPKKIPVEYLTRPVGEFARDVKTIGTHIAGGDVRRYSEKDMQDIRADFVRRAVAGERLTIPTNMANREEFERELFGGILGADRSLMDPYYDKPLRKYQYGEGPGKRKVVNIQPEVER